MSNEHKYTHSQITEHKTHCLYYLHCKGSSVLITPFLCCVPVCHVLERSEGYACMKRFCAVIVSQLSSKGFMSITHSVCFHYPRLAVHPSIHLSSFTLVCLHFHPSLLFSSKSCCVLHRMLSMSVSHQMKWGCIWHFCMKNVLICKKWKAIAGLSKMGSTLEKKSKNSDELFCTSYKIYINLLNLMKKEAILASVCWAYFYPGTFWVSQAFSVLLHFSWAWLCSSWWHWIFAGPAGQLLHVIEIFFYFISSAYRLLMICDFLYYVSTHVVLLWL